MYVAKLRIKRNYTYLFKCHFKAWDNMVIVFSFDDKTSSSFSYPRPFLLFPSSTSGNHNQCQSERHLINLRPRSHKPYRPNPFVWTWEIVFSCSLNLKVKYKRRIQYRHNIISFHLLFGSFSDTVFQAIENPGCFETWTLVEYSR